MLSTSLYSLILMCTYAVAYDPDMLYCQVLKCAFEQNLLSGNKTDHVSVQPVHVSLHSYKAWEVMYSKERYWASPIVVVLAQKQSWFRQSSFRISPFELQEVPLVVRLQ